MNLPISISTNSGELTMSSREISELVESRHDKVKQSIERLAERGVIVRPPMGDEQKPDAMGRMRTEGVYLINKRDSYVVVAQLSPEFTARLVDRWQELEQKAAQPLSKAEMTLMVIGGLQEEVAQQAALIEQQKPAVEFVNRYVNADSGSKGFRQVAKLLKANENQFRAFLCEQKIMYRLGGEWMPHSNHIDAGRFEVKAGVAGEHAFNQAKFTAKGVSWIAGLLACGRSTSWG